MNRLRQHQQFSAALKSRPKNEGWVAAHIVDNQIGYPRLGIVVSKRVIARAVDRNRAKRLIREIFRYQIQQLGSQDVVVRVRINPFIENIEKAEPPSFAISRLFKVLHTNL